MFIVLSPSSPDPMYKQVTDQIKNAIASGDLKPGEKLRREKLAEFRTTLSGLLATGAKFGIAAGDLIELIRELRERPRAGPKPHGAAGRRPLLCLRDQRRPLRLREILDLAARSGWPEAHPPRAEDPDAGPGHGQAGRDPAHADLPPRPPPRLCRTSMISPFRSKTG
jgi:hypothetical protein